MGKSKQDNIYTNKDKLYDVVMDLLDRVHDNYSALDSKINLYFILEITLLGFFIKFSSIPNQLYLAIILYTIIIIGILILIFLIIAYNPKAYPSLESDKIISLYNELGYEESIGHIIKNISLNIEDIKKICYIKSKYILIVSWLIFSELILMAGYILLSN